MSYQGTKEEIQKLLVGEWEGVDNKYTFYSDGRYKSNGSVSGTVSPRASSGESVISSYYYRNYNASGTYFINDACELVFRSDDGQEYKPPFEIGRGGGEIRIGKMWVSKVWH